VDNNWDDFFAFDGKSPELPASKPTPKRTTPIDATRKPTPISPAHPRRSHLREHTRVPPSSTDDDDWDKDFEGGLMLRSPKILPAQLPPLPPLSPKKILAPPRKLSPPKLSAGSLSDDNSKTIRPAPFSRPSQSRKVSADSNVSSNGNTVRAVSINPLPSPTRTKSTSAKSSSHEKKKMKQRRIASQEEHSDDGYEDLIKDNETKFAMKINSLKVRSQVMRLMLARYIFFTKVVVSIGSQVSVKTLDYHSSVTVTFTRCVVSILTPTEERIAQAQFICS
jgi:hypothetical protein